MGEIGTISALDHVNQTIQLNNSYLNPVVFALPVSFNDADPAIARITDIQDDNFSVYLQEGEYDDGIHSAESVSYIVLEAGEWELPDGTLLEVGTLDTNSTTKSRWSSIDFESDFSATPAILSQVQTDNDEQFVRTRQKSADITGVKLALEEEEIFKFSGHGTETVGWLAMESGSGDWDGLEYEVGKTGRKVNHSWDLIDFGQSFEESPNLLASLASFRGGNAAGLRYDNLGSSSVEFKIEEDQTKDREIWHRRESVDFLAIAGSGDLSAFAL